MNDTKVSHSAEQRLIDQLVQYATCKMDNIQRGCQYDHLMIKSEKSDNCHPPFGITSHLLSSGYDHHYRFNIPSNVQLINLSNLTIEFNIGADEKTDMDEYIRENLILHLEIFNEACWKAADSHVYHDYKDVQRSTMKLISYSDNKAVYKLEGEPEFILLDDEYPWFVTVQICHNKLLKEGWIAGPTMNIPTENASIFNEKYNQQLIDKIKEKPGFAMHRFAKFDVEIPITYCLNQVHTNKMILARLFRYDKVKYLSSLKESIMNMIASVFQ